MNLSESLTELRRERCRKYWSIALLWLFAGNLGTMAFLFILDNLSGFSRDSRIFLLLLFAAGNLTAWIILIRNAFSLRRTERDDAVELERINKITDNVLVNAVCFRRDSTLPDHLVSYFSERADERCRSILIPGMLHDALFRRALTGCGIICFACLLYLLPFHKYARNAFARFANPASRTASLNFTSFEVDPGNCRVPRGNNLTVRVRAFYNGHELSDLKLLIETAIPPVLYHMDNGTFTLKQLSRDIVYSIKTGRESSEKFSIRVVAPPSIPDFKLSISPPAYIGRKTEILTPGEQFKHSAPEGSTVTVVCGGIQPCLYINGKPQPTGVPFPLNEDLQLRISLKDRDGLFFENAWSGELKCLKDNPPEVRFLNTKNNLEAGYGELIPIRISASDDYGVSSIRLAGEVEGKTIPFKEYRYPAPGFRNRNEVFLLKLTPAILPAGGTLELKTTAKDTKQQETTSQSTITIHQIDLTERLKNQLASGDAAKCYELLFTALREQTAVRDRISLQLKQFPNHQRDRLYREQTRIDKHIQNAEREAGKAKLPSPFLRALKILNTDSNLLLNDVNEMRKAPSSLKINTIVLKQTALIEKLRKLLGALALRQRNEENKKALAKENEAEKELYEQMKQLKDKLERFKNEQRKIKADTENFDPKKTDDWSEGEEKLLGDLAAKEQDWAQFFKTAFSDLSKKQNQDFSNSAMADEFVELYEELQKAGNALKAKKIEIATVAEDTALVGAENVIANLERWLSDKQDYIKWVAEEDGKSQDVKLTDLPAELTDIIGDLIEQEEDMGEDTNDSSNSFSYDSDDGLGWGVADGNIDSMQAKGITGNVLPNNNEVGGRSGEGRSGRSSGQFVEKEATGKGGRKTPTRLVQSPFEKGTVSDKSKDPQGGASGGGKQSGVGDEGLSGITPDQDQKTGIRLAGNQAELKQRTEAMLKRLDDANLPAGDLRDALEKMRALERIGSGDGPEIRRLKSEAAFSLRKARTALEVTVQAEKEKLRRRQKETFPVKYRYHEKVPPAFEEYVGEYFKAIAIEEASE